MYQECWPESARIWKRQCDCDLKTTSFSGTTATLDPKSGGSVSFDFDVSGPYDSYEITVAGRAVAGTTWNGRDENGKIVAPGFYPATLQVRNSSDPGCKDASSVTIAVIENPANCRLEVSFGSSANLAGGNLSRSQPLLQQH